MTVVNDPIDKLYINYKGENLLRLKVKAPNKNVDEGEVDILIDIFGEKSIKTLYATNNRLVDIGFNVDAISWHSFQIEKGNGISVPKIHFKWKEVKRVYDSGDYVNYNNIIPYPVLTLNLYEEWRSLKKYIPNKYGKTYDVEEMLPICIDIFVLPKNVKFIDFMQKFDASIFVVISCNTIFLDIFDEMIEECHYKFEKYPKIDCMNINGWDILIRKSNPPLYTKLDTIPEKTIITYDLKNAVSSLIDRKIGYPEDDGTVTYTTFRERLNMKK